MQYEITKEKSAEYLRQAIQHMSMQDAAFHPVSYAVWYEYSSGEHAHLIDEVNSLIEKEKKLNEKSTAQLFNKHIASLDADSAQDIVDRFNHVVSDISASTEKAGQDTSHFSKTLDAWSGELQQLDGEVSRHMVGLLSETANIQQSMQTLQHQLTTSLHEITDLKNEIIKAKQEAISDGLTGLMNRRGFDVTLKHSLESASDFEDTCLIIGDIDFFKRVNDSYGHLFGDKVIQAVARIMKTVSGDLYTAARYGGEEFVLLLPHTPLETAREVAETIRRHVANISIKNNVTSKLISNITISLGVTAYQAGETAESFLNRADQALYTSKAKGRNQVTLIADELAAA
ncbi:MAG: GGDEF domain-containing protein [Methylophilus sp.]|jgi:diguanylate cyclase|uniref:GGDEF domain-containing protein n=1 Tax=Methylophilus sp. TaxID=29541 RepID=UPI002CB63F6D|nr:GGDEF domain-containing protein [Methylophilus sp.]HSH86538.1 GGDEF domain-containing protein [Methylophilus sp.]